jgi:anaerobic selenocysteine-containing dehydrogenase
LVAGSKCAMHAAAAHAELYLPSCEASEIWRSISCNSHVSRRRRQFEPRGMRVSAYTIVRLEFAL